MGTFDPSPEMVNAFGGNESRAQLATRWGISLADVQAFRAMGIGNPGTMHEIQNLGLTTDQVEPFSWTWNPPEGLSDGTIIDLLRLVATLGPEKVQAELQGARGGAIVTRISDMSRQHRAGRG